METESENLDAPGCDSFRVRLSQMVVSSKKFAGKSMLLWIMLCDFYKFSFVKMIIVAKSKEAISDETKLWFAYMTK